MSDEEQVIDIHRVLAFLRKSAIPAAQARADRLHLEDYSRVLKATIMAEHLDDPVSAQERWAYADPRYAAHLEALKAAIAKDEELRYMREAALVKAEVWRSMEASNRAQDRAHA